MDMVGYLYFFIISAKDSPLASVSMEFSWDPYSRALARFSYGSNGSWQTFLGVIGAVYVFVTTSTFFRASTQSLC